MAIEIQSRMDAYLGAFPNIESRHSAALQLADPNGSGLPYESYPSWDLMAAHWGDTEEELRAIGDFAWNLYNDLPSEGGPVAIITQGRAAELLADKSKLDDEIKLTAGIITKKELIHGFAGYVTSRGPGRMGVRPPYLGFGLQLKLSHVVKIEAGMAGDYTAVRAADETQMIPVYFGVVTLSEKPNDYRPNRKVVQRDILIGRQVCSQAEEAIGAKTRTTSVPTLAA